MASEEPERTYAYIRLATKSSAELCYSFSPATAFQVDKQSLIVFVNGLGLPQTGWEETISILRQSKPDDLPAILTYDRFGQGQTGDRDPADEGAADAMHGHDCMSAVGDMRQLITQVAVDKMKSSSVDDVKLIMVGNSIGCALIRLYAQEHPETVAGAIFLDSTLTNSDFVSIFPDPDADDFNAKLPRGVTPENLRFTRERIGKLFHPNVGSKEGLSRKNIGQLLPHADKPGLRGPGGRGPYVTVIGHDSDAFADDTEEKLGIPAALTHVYMNPFWHRYNQGLAKLTELKRSEGCVHAPGASHFIQADNPGFVAERLSEMLEML